jgi:UDP-glucose 4-epimerase
MKIFSLRPANIYGYWDTNKSRIIPNTFTKLIRGESPVVFTDSKDQLREYVYVNDVCDIIVKMIEGNITPQAYNISSGIVKSPEQVIDLIKGVMDADIPTTIIEKPFMFQEIQSQALNGDRLMKELNGSFTFTPMEAALELMWDDIQERGYGA